MEELNLQYPESTSSRAELVPLPTPIDETQSGLTLVQLEQTALSLNPSIRRLSSLVGAAHGHTLQVGLKPNPSIGYEGQQLGSGGQAEQHGVLFSQEIVRGGKLQLNRAVANRERMRLEQELAAQQFRVLSDVRIAYYQVLLAQRQIDIAEELLHISEEGTHTVEQLFQAQEVSRADILQAQLEVETARILGENSRNRHRAAWQRLAAVIGNPTLPPQPLSGEAEESLPNLDFEESLSRLLERSPEIAAAAREIERAGMALERERVEPIPNIQVHGLINWEDRGVEGKPNGGIAVSLPIPLYNRNQGAIARSEHELIAARQALAEVQLGLQQRLATTFEQYANGRYQVERYQQLMLPAAEESLELIRALYASGETNYIALLTAQRTYSQVQLNYLDALRVLRIAGVEIDGLLLQGSLRGSTMGEPRPVD